jgi:hypothetical protein
LADVSASPDLARGLSREDAEALFLQAARQLRETETAKAALAIRLFGAGAFERDGGPAARPEPPTFLDLVETARRLRLSPLTLKRKARTPPYRDLRGNNGTRNLVFVSDKVAAFLRGTSGPPACDTTASLGSPPRPSLRARRKPVLRAQRFPLPSDGAG